MKRLHLFEFGDQSWCPLVIRRGITEFLATIAQVSKMYSPTAQVIQELLDISGKNRIVALAAGSGGGILDILPKLPQETEVILTDILPDQNFISPSPRVTYYPASVDATRIPQELQGVRVMYGAFHHFSFDLAQNILADAVRNRQPIAIFESTERSSRGLINPFFAPLAVLLLTPFIKPFRVSRLIFTYIVPLLPIVLFWDGLVSTLRTYSHIELKDMVTIFPNYTWKILTLKGPHQENIPTLIGVPKKNDTQN